MVDESDMESPIPDALGSYAELYSRTDIHAIYIPLPTAVRVRECLAAMCAGKGVLTEKPVAVTLAEAEELVDQARRQGVFLMDGVMFMHNARLKRIKTALYTDKAIGDVKQVTMGFSFPGGEGFQESDIRCQSDLEPLGALGDLGIYCIRFALFIFHWEMPSRVYAKTNQMCNGVPLDCTATLYFSESRLARFDCSFLLAKRQWAEVAGTEKVLTVPGFVNPYKNENSFSVTGVQSQKYTPKRIEEQFECPEGAEGMEQHVQMVETMSRAVLEGEKSDFWEEILLKTQKVLNACMESIKSGESVHLSTS